MQAVITKKAGYKMRKHRGCPELEGTLFEHGAVVEGAVARCAYEAGAAQHLTKAQLNRMLGKQMRNMKTMKLDTGVINAELKDLKGAK